MHERVVTRRLTALAAAVLVVLAGLSAWWLLRPEPTALEQAVALAPASAERLSWTDWAGVRRELGSDVAASDFLDAAFDADLSSRSALLASAGRLQELYGWSPATVEWELFSQGTDGAVIMVRLPDDADFGELADRLRALGYPRPDEVDGVWEGGPDLVSALDPTLTPELAYVALDADDHLVLTSDQPAYLQRAVAAATGADTTQDGATQEGATQDGTTGLDRVAHALGDPLSAAVYSGDYACGALAMAHADADDQATAAGLVARAGTVDPYRAFAMGVRPGGEVRVAMEFADDDQAERNADSRAVLATGPAVGQGGDFGDRFALTSARADEGIVTLDLDPRPGQYVLSDLTSGPVLFATC